MVFEIALYRGNVEDFNSQNITVLDRFEADYIEDKAVINHLRPILEQVGCEQHNGSFFYQWHRWSENVVTIDFGSYSKFLRIKSYN